MYQAAVDVVTGWLGSGKTTLLRRLLESPAGRRAAVIVNELAPLDVDGRVLGGLGAIERAIELPGGCLCCEIAEARLAGGIRELLERAAPDLVVVETSGVADPGAVVERLRGAGLTLDAVIALVDAEHGSATLDGSRVARAQVAAADFAIVNRVDLATADAVRAVERHVAGCNPRALVRRAVRADVELDLLFASGAGRLRRSAERDGGELAVEHGLTARVHRSAAALDRTHLEHMLARLPESVHRAKGIARVADSDLGLLFNAVRRRVELEWLPFATADTQAVFLGEDMDAAWPAITAALAACVAAAPHAPREAPEARRGPVA